MLRFACGLLQVVTALLAAEAVWRLTSARVAAIAAAGLVVVTPWATHQHGLLLPEQLGAPLLLGAALLASRPASARWAGVLAGVAVFAKLPFFLPAALIVAASPGRRVALRWAAGALAVQAVLFTALFGTGFWGQVVGAQVQSGDAIELQVGAFVQASWNLLPLVILAAAAIWLRRQTTELALLGTLTAGAVGALALTLTIVKPGTGLNVVVPSEPLLATLAVAGVVFALRIRRRCARARSRWPASWVSCCSRNRPRCCSIRATRARFIARCRRRRAGRSATTRPRCGGSLRRRRPARRAASTSGRRSSRSSPGAGSPPTSPTRSSSAMPRCTPTCSRAGSPPARPAGEVCRSTRSWTDQIDATPG